MSAAAPDASLSRSALSWLRLLASPLGASAAASAAALFGSALIYRVLPEADAGAFALVTAFVQTVLILGGLGQYTLTLRLYSRAEQGAFRWRRDLASQTLFTFPACGLLTVFITAVYHLPAGQSIFLLVSALLLGVLTTLAGMLASQRRYTWSAGLPRLPNGLLALPALLMVAIPALAVLPVALLGLLLATLASLTLGWWAMSRLGQHGAQTIALRQRGFGLVFLASQFSTLVPDYLLLAGAAFFVPAGDLALFAAVALLFRPTQLLQNVLAQVLTTELARARQPRMRRMAALFAAGATAIVAGGLLLVPAITDGVYGSRYAPGLALVGWISLASGLDILETLPRSYLTGRASRRVLAWFSGSQVAIAAAGLLVGMALIQQQGIEGAAAGAALIFIARNVTTYTGFFVVRAQERARSAVQ